MKKRFAKFLALALVLVMVLSAIPFSAIAQGFVNDGNETTAIGDLWSKLRGGLNDFFRPRPTTPPTTDGRSFTGVTESGLTVNVDAPAGAFMNGTTMTVREVANMQAVQDAVDNTDGVSGTVLAAVDITFMLRGREVQPTKDITVSITSDALASVSNPSVVHIDASADELGGEEDADLVANVKSGNSSVTFEADSFSIYAVIGGGQTGDKARAKVIFKNVGATESDDSEIASMWIKQDDTPEELKYIVYDPGAGTIAAGNMFVGWSRTREFTTDSPRMTIQDVRNWLDQQVIEEGEEFVFYAMIFTVYTISFIGEEGEQTGVKVSLGSDSVVIPTTSENATYKIELDYNPDGYNQHFEGWLASEDTIDNIVSVTVDGQPIAKTGHIPVNAVLTIKGDIKLSVDAPEGYWVIYKENAKGATYIAPDFYPNGTTTTAPDKTPKRYGYDFGGWYTNQECTGTAYPFNTTLDANVTLYAKWNAHTNAPYTVIIWKQNVSGEGYDFEEYIPIESGTVGAAQTAVTSSGSGNARKAIVNGTTKSYTGFHLDHYDSDKVIRTEGDTVVNVYYNRNEHTFTFIDEDYPATTSSEYTPTTGTSGTQYGLYNGEYIQLTRSGNYWYMPIGSASQGVSEDVVYDSATNYYRPTNNGFGTLLYDADDENNKPWYYQAGYNTYYYYTGDIYIRYTGTRYTLSSTSTTTIHTVTRLYGQDISDIWNFTGDNGRTYPQTSPATSWQPSGSNTYTARITRMEIMPDEDITFTHTTSSNTTRYFYYFVEALDGTAEHDISQATTPREDYHTIRHGADNKLYILKIYLPNDFNIVFYNDDFFNMAGFSRDEITYSNGSHVSALDEQGEQATWTSLNNGLSGASQNVLYFFYDRDKKEIDYMDGIYVDGSGNSISLPNRGELNKVTGIYYGTDLASYNKGGNDYYAPECTAEGYEGFVFEGWYLDPACSARATFTTMQNANIVVYAKWRQIEYRVYLQPNMHDTGLDWGDTTPTMCFRVAYNGLVELRDGRVPGKYMFLGWWMDEEMEDYPYIEDVTVLNKDIEDQFMEDYDMNVDYTDTYDRYGDLQNPKENSDLTGYDPDPEDPYNALEPRFWITKKLTLFAKWRGIYEGVDGIQVIYDEGDGTNPPSDPLTYLDESDAIARAASSAPEGYVFLYWVLQTWDVDAGKFVDLDAEKYYYYPGAKFTVDDANAHLYTENDVTRMEVQLRAEYGKIGEITPTHIYWYSNMKDLDQGAMEKDNFTKPNDVTVFEDNKGWRMETPNVYINVAYNIPSADTYSYPGYEFVGWARINNETGYPGNSDYTNITMADLFLKWVVDTPAQGKAPATGHYEAQNDDGDWVPVTQVAADERHSYHDLYAMWTAKEAFYVFHSSDGSLEAIMPDDARIKSNGAFDLTDLVRDGFIYGGYYKMYGGTIDLEGDSDAAKDARFHALHYKTTPTDAYKVPGAKAYDGTSMKVDNTNIRYWTKSQAYGYNAENNELAGTGIKPVMGKVYYLKEVPNLYLNVHARWIFYWRTGEITDIYMLTCIDDSLYSEVGYEIITDDNNKARITTSFKYLQRGQSEDQAVTITASDLCGRRGYIGVVDTGANDIALIDAIFEATSSENSVLVRPYWYTLDGVEVYNGTCSLYSTGDGEFLAHGDIHWDIMNPSRPSTNP